MILLCCNTVLNIAKSYQIGSISSFWNFSTYILICRDWGEKGNWVFLSLRQYYLLYSNILCAILMIRLWEFQNAKMSLYSSKIDRDIAKNVKIQILKNDSFCLKKLCFFLAKTAIFQNFLHFLLYLGKFWCYICPFYHFGILNVSALKWRTACLN